MPEMTLLCSIDKSREMATWLLNYLSKLIRSIPSNISSSDNKGDISKQIIKSTYNHHNGHSHKYMTFEFLKETKSSED